MNREVNLIGQKFGSLTVLKKYGEKPKSGILNWECLCECGNKCIVSTKNLRRKNYPTISCGCKRHEYKDLTGKRFGKLIVIERAEDYVIRSGQHFRQWKCVCDCGNTKIAKEAYLKNGKTSHCGCETKNITSKSRTLDLSGKRFGKLTAIEISKIIYSKEGKATKYWKCLCDCGNYTEVQVGHLTSGHSKSCGCLNDKERLGNITRKHGMSHTKIYNAYLLMIRRCDKPNNPRYKDYGGRGITVCDEWRGEYGFENFYKWAIENGYDETKSRNEQSIDRIDNNGNYCPENCRFANIIEQANNKRTTARAQYNGKMYSMKELSEKTGLDRGKLYRKIIKEKKDAETAIMEIRGNS